VADWVRGAHKSSEGRFSLFSLFAHAGAWQVSEYCALPRVASADDESLRDYCLIAGGLALVLSRCPQELAARRFAATLQLYAELVALHHGNRADLSRELVSDVSHEVAEFTDRATRDALLRRMRSL